MQLARRCGQSRLLVLLAALIAVGGATAASSAVTLHAVTNAALRARIVVDSGGFTLYHLTSEKKGSIGCSGSCRKTWPPLLVVGAEKPLAGAGLSASKLGTIKRRDGGVQLTYNGYALYLYSGDKKAGQTHGQGVERLWYAMTPAGVVTRAAVKGATSPTTTGPGIVVVPPASTTPSPGATTTGPTDTADSCLPGQGIPQQGSGDDDDDNNGGPSDGDGCM
jgi:predicted lipoprotein with Yx(FWY)xxD motif